MKKTLIAFTLASLFIAGAVQAEDHSATVDITGSVTGSHSECTVYTDSTVTLSGNLDTLLDQGEKANSPTMLNYSIGSNGDTSCLNKIALKLEASTYDAEGTVLINDNSGTTAAKGIGIGVYDSELNPLNINEDTITTETNIGHFNLQLVKLKGIEAVEGSVHSSLTLNIVHIQFLAEKFID